MRIKILLALALLPAASGFAQPPHFPETQVLDQNGRRLSFYSDLVKGHTVAVDFIFTSCTTICPVLSANFRKVQQELGTNSGDVRLISVSIDPATDTPERLKQFAARFNAGPGWTLVTGGKQEIDGLLNALGAAVSNKLDHTPTILIGNDPAGYWRRVDGLSSSSAIFHTIQKAASHQPVNSTEAQAAAYFPNLELLTQEGAHVRFYDDVLKGKTVLINFLFTTCTGVCSPMTANLARVQKFLGARLGQDILMVSITVDPRIDTPPVLKEYATKFGARPGWYFLTGSETNVDGVLSKLGGHVEDKNQHSSVLIIGNVARGGWRKIFPLGDPATIANIALDLAR